MRSDRSRGSRAARPPPTDGAVAREERRRRAAEEALDVRPRDDLPFPSYEVRNPIHGTHYRVLAPGPEEAPVLLCPCPDFGHRDVGTCKHVEAVRAARARPGAASAPFRSRAGAPEGLWERIDAALAAEPPRPWTDLRPRERSDRWLVRPVDP